MTLISECDLIKEHYKGYGIVLESFWMCQVIVGRGGIKDVKD